MTRRDVPLIDDQLVLLGPSAAEIHIHKHAYTQWYYRSGEQTLKLVPTTRRRTEACGPIYACVWPTSLDQVTHFMACLHMPSVSTRQELSLGTHGPLITR